MAWFGNLLDNGIESAGRIIKGVKQGIAKGTTKASDDVIEALKPPTFKDIEDDIGNINNWSLARTYEANHLVNQELATFGSDKDILAKANTYATKKAQESNLESFKEITSDQNWDADELQRQWNSLDDASRAKILGNRYVNDKSNVYQSWMQENLQEQNDRIQTLSQYKNEIKNRIAQQNPNIPTVEAMDYISSQHYQRTYSAQLNAEQQAQSMGGSWLKYGIGGTVVTGGLVLALNSSRGSQTNAQLYGQQPIY